MSSTCPLVRRGPAKGPLSDEKHLLHRTSPKDSLSCKKWDDERIREDHRRKSQAEVIKATTLWFYYSAHLSDLCVSALSVLLFLSCSFCFPPRRAPRSNSRLPPTPQVAMLAIHALHSKNLRRPPLP